MHPFDELRWVVRVRQVLEEELDGEEEGHPVSISDVPKPLLSNKPDAYIPQLIALGPYHHFREELRHMERYKLSAAKRIQSHLPNLRFQHLVDLLAKLEHQIRAHYHRFLNLNGETLAWMMAMDVSFLLEFLQIYSINQGKNLRRTPSRMSHFVDLARRTSTHNMLLRDIIMLENQIPLFLLQKILEVQCSSSRATEEMLSSMLIGFLKEVSPFIIVESSPCIALMQQSHLLELLYHIVISKSEEISETIEENDHDDHSDETNNCMKRFLCASRDLIFIRASAFFKVIIKFLVRIPWKIVTSVTAFSILKHPIENLLFSERDKNLKSINEVPNKNPALLLLEEIAIPSVTELNSAGIRFLPTSGDLSTMEFNMRTATFHLPVLSVDVNTEVVLRNLVAYEASIGSRPLVFSRYIELMNGIIDTAEDAKLLRESGVVMNHLKSDKEVAELWNGMTRSIRITRVLNLDRIIEDVNKYYYSRWRVKIKRFMQRHVVGLWKSLVCVAALLLLLVMSVQAFCAARGCSRSSRVGIASP